MNSTNANRSPRIQRRPLTNPIGSASPSPPPLQLQNASINPMGQHHNHRHQHGSGAVGERTGTTVIGLKTPYHLPNPISSPTITRKISQNGLSAFTMDRVANLCENYFTDVPLPSASNASNGKVTESQQQQNQQHISEHQQNLSVSSPLRTAGGSSPSSSSSSSSTLNNNYYQTTAAIRCLLSPPLLPPATSARQHPQREGQRNNINVQRNFDRESSVDTGIATQLCHPPFHIQQRAIYMCRMNSDGGGGGGGSSSGVGTGYQMEPVIKSRKVIGVLDVTQLINDSRCSNSPFLQTYNYF